MTPGDRILRLSAGILRQVAGGAPLERVLCAIVRMLESVEPGALGSIVLLDEAGSRISSAVGPSLPAEYLDGLCGLRMGPGVGTCGEAMHRRQRVVTEDIETDPNWASFRGLARIARLRACWSEPILDPQGRALGSFAIYRREPGRPSAAQLGVIGAATDLARLAIEIDQSRRTAAAAEARLAASEARYRTLFQLAPVGIIVNELRTGRFLAANPAMSEMIGHDEAALRGMVYAELLPPEYADQERAALDMLWRTGSHPPIERQMIRADGSRLDIVISAVLKPGGEADPLVLSAVQDISAQKRTENSLRVLGDRLALAMQASGLGVLDYDIPAERLICNARMAEIYGFDGPEGLARADWIARIHPDDRPAIEERFRQARENALPGPHHAFRVVLPDRTLRHIRSTTRVICEDGRAVRVVGVNRDVTAEVEMAEALRARTREAEAANLAKSQFLANMSHEIRTPLNGVLGAAQLLEHSALSEGQRGYVSVIRSSGEALLELIEDLLDLSRIEAGVIRIQDAPYDTAAMVEGALGTLRGLAEDKGLSIGARIAPGAEGWFLGDARRIRQVLINLLGNAVKFTTAGGIALEVSAERDRLRYRVTDTGCGIAREHLDAIFARFSQASQSHAGRHRGTGLGLSICRELVGLMGGEIGVESRLGQGSSFWFDLPRRPCAAPAPRLTAVSGLG